MAAGLGFKTFTTGEVLTAADTNGYLMQGVLVFASAAARDAAITSPQEGQCCYLKDTDAVLTYSGAAWVGFDDTNAIQNTIVDAKGDLIAASAADTPARLAVGSNGETLVADSAATTGLRYQSAYNGNAIINGGMDVWQRGTANMTGVSAYTADRWQKGGGTYFGVSRQVTGDSTNLPNIQYCARVQRTAGSTVTTGMNLGYSMETSDSIRFSGQTVTLSFWARAGANYSATSSLLDAGLYSGTGTDQNIMTTGLTGQLTVIQSNKTLTTTWQRFTLTGTVSSTSTQLALYFSTTSTGTAGANDYFDITGLQIELGSVPTSFKRSGSGGGTIQGELAACQRYYYQWTAANAYSPFGVGFTQGTTLAILYKAMPVVMRTTPTITTTGTAANYAVMNGNTGRIACSAVPVINQGNPDGLILDWASTGLTSGGAIEGNANNTTAAYVGFSAEL